ncbi:uncharacterized protein PHACADRAFT_193814 [Phanerochaete carnosa HHB-10118-sp]|uniref:Uncharacterized protein n=1 Tax=Phanerochaete carnosa (strain HHB-10118-sp) TaxID=650164 RepID=K5X748_PHACS|nr:uncharacterized protein PHACADRAFT_193814 [Phanerochaete carnosa HHB-10118-sp]EKM58697.1 hypothetical protein PHACADRAFT_193814 [Phanerochaete carnosa HHB-10118-sp]
MRPSSDPLNAGGVPNGFVVLEPDKGDFYSEHVPPGPIYTPNTIFHKADAGTSDPTQSVDETYTFECPDGRGATAVLRDFGLREGYRSNRRFSDYVAKHHSSWYELATKSGFPIRPEAIILVSGWLKTTNWETAAVSNSGPAVGLSFTLADRSLSLQIISGRTGRHVDTDYRWSSADDPRFATPGAPTEQQKLPRDQCLFRRPTATAAVACYEDFYSVFPPDKYLNGVKKRHVMKRILSHDVNVRLGEHGMAYMCRDDDARTASEKDMRQEDIALTAIASSIPTGATSETAPVTKRASVEEPQ